MDICIDSNILIYNLNKFSPFYADVSNSISKLDSIGENLIIFPQNLIEFWAVITRPVISNGLGFAPVRAAEEIAQIRSIFQLIPETQEIYPEWQRLVVAHGVSGKNVHDTRIAAQMNVNNIDNILTFNAKDFKRFENITAVDPTSV